MSTLNYSKWDKIEVSDDEDEVHPNIDTPSLFRWRHQARVERAEAMKEARESLEKNKKRIQDEKKAISEKLKSSENKDELQKQMKKLEDELKTLEVHEENLTKQEKNEPLNVDTLSQPKFSRTVINTKKEKSYSDMTEDEKEGHMQDFVKKHEEKMKKFGMMRKFEDSKAFLVENNFLVCEDTANYLVIWCINLEMTEKHELMTHIAHQCICLQYILELARQLDTDPRACIGPFFDRIQIADVSYKNQFEDEIAQFIGRIEKRAKEKLDKLIAEEEEKEKQERLGPGGLDPVEVYESLPKELQDCFESRNLDLLKEVIAKMPEDQAKYHMKRCVDSGMWVPDANAGDDGLLDSKPQEEAVYESVEKKTDLLDLD